MPRVLEVIPHPTGSWLVKAGPTHYAVPRGIGRALLPLAGGVPNRREIQTRLAEVGLIGSGGQSVPALENWIRDLVGALKSKGSPDHSSPSRRRTVRTVRCRIPLLPEGIVRRVAAKLAPLTGAGGLSALTLVGGAGCLAAAFGPGPFGFSLDHESVIAWLGFFFMTALWHELGHAAALARAGYPAGGIGAGLLFVIPVLFADVTAVGALSRRDRLRVDSAGMIFQLSVAGCFLAAGAWGFGPSALGWAGGSALLAMAWSLFPFVRSDGYWLLCDLLGLPDLDRPPASPVSPFLRIFLPSYQLTNAIFLVWVGLYFPWRLTGLLFSLFQLLPVPLEPSWAKGLSILAGAAFLGLMGVGIFRRVTILVRSAWLVARNDV